MDNKKIDLEEIKSKIVLSEFARKYLGCNVNSNKKMCCHLHPEKTPSLNFNDEKGFYYCFGCQGKGDVFSLTQEIKNFSFLEALQFVAETIGVKIETNYNLLRESNQIKEKREIVYKITDDLLRIFRGNLRKQTDAIDYLKKRGLTDDSIERFNLGFSDSNDADILNFFREKYQDDYRMILDSGVFRKSNYRQNDIYNILQNRIIFPIFDKFGRAIAFSGRAFGGNSGAKYINCSDSIIFKKGEHLYGENLAIKEIRSRNCAVIVEGNIDVIMMHQIGFENTVASLGTAISEYQLQYLWSHCDTILCVFDGDVAGRKAMISTIKKGLNVMQAGKFLSFALLKKGDDPASMVVEGKAVELKKAIIDAKMASEIIFKVLWAKYKSTKSEHMAAIKRELSQYLDMIKDEIIKNEYREYFKKIFEKITNHQKKIELYANESNFHTHINYNNSNANYNGYPRKEFNKIICKKGAYELIFCFIMVFFNKFSKSHEFIDKDVVMEICDNSEARQKIEDRLKYNVKKLIMNSWSLDAIDLEEVRAMFIKDRLTVFNDYIKDAENRLQNANNDDDMKKIWLKSVDLRIVNDRIMNIENERERTYETEKMLFELKARRSELNKMIEE